MRKSYSGAAAATTLSSPMGTTDTTATVGATTNWPNTATGPFVITIDRGTTSEEKILVSAYTATGFTVASGGRGYDGTTALAHAAGATVNCTLDAVTIDEANAFVNSIGTVTPTTSAVGDAPADGTSTVPAASDHRHGRESFVTGATTTSAVGDAASDGVSASPARADHKHGRESFAVGATTTQTYGEAPSDGASADPARADHSHGMPVGVPFTEWPAGGPPAGTPLSLKTGSTVATTDGQGRVGIAFVTAFPNATLVALVSMGDNNDPAVFPQVIAGQVSAAGFGVEVWNSSGPFINAGVRINWMAAGW